MVKMGTALQIRDYKLSVATDINGDKHYILFDELGRFIDESYDINKILSHM